MKNWEVLQKKISEMSKEEFIKFAKKEMFCNALRYILDITSRCEGCLFRYSGTNIDCKRNLLESECQLTKQEKWIVHRTLRKQNKETYVGYRTYTDYDDVKCGYTMVYQKEYAKRYDEKEAIKVRDELNERRIGRRYLWVISKVEE